jgi:predicted transcriptional regulator
MNALLERIDFSPYMSKLTALTVHIAAELKSELEERARRARLTVDELTEQMIRVSLFRSSAEYHDPASERAREFRLIEEGLAEIHRGETVSLEDIEKSLDELLGAERSRDLPSKR